MAGIASLCPEFRWVNDGLDGADSWCTNPHKWMGIHFDCDLLYVADRAALTGALAILPEYLRTSAGDAGGAIDLRDWQVPLGRRFRALKLWFALRTEGGRRDPGNDPTSGRVGSGAGRLGTRGSSV